MTEIVNVTHQFLGLCLSLLCSAEPQKACLCLEPSLTFAEAAVDKEDELLELLCHRRYRLGIEEIT